MASHRRSRSLSTPSEGEIIETGSELKATASQPPLNGTSVDRPPRASAPRSPASRGSRSPRRRNSWTRSRSRSPSRSPYRENRDRGYKRRRDDEYENSRYESSRYGSRYDDRQDRGPSRRPNKPYHDYDREETYGDGLRYTDDYDQRQDKRQRTRNRSPYRDPRKQKKYDEPDSNAHSTDRSGHGTSSGQIVGERKTSAGSRDSKLGAETQSTQVQQALPSRVHFADEYVLRYVHLRNLGLIKTIVSTLLPQTLQRNRSLLSRLTKLLPWRHVGNVVRPLGRSIEPR